MKILGVASGLSRFMKKLSSSLEAEEDIYSLLQTQMHALQHTYISSPLHIRVCFKDVVNNLKPPVQHLKELAKLGMNSFFRSGDDDFHVLCILYVWWYVCVKGPCPCSKHKRCGRCSRRIKRGSRPRFGLNMQQCGSRPRFGLNALFYVTVTRDDTAGVICVFGIKYTLSPVDVLLQWTVCRVWLLLVI